MLQARFAEGSPSSLAEVEGTIASLCGMGLEIDGARNANAFDVVACCIASELPGTVWALGFSCIVSGAYCVLSAFEYGKSVAKAELEHDARLPSKRKKSYASMRFLIQCWNSASMLPRGAKTILYLVCQLLSVVVIFLHKMLLPSSLWKNVGSFFMHSHCLLNQSIYTATKTFLVCARACQTHPPGKVCTSPLNWRHHAERLFTAVGHRYSTLASLGIAA